MNARFALLVLALLIGWPASAHAATGCGSRTDSLFDQATAAYNGGHWSLTSADMQEAASEYAACAQHARRTDDRPRYYRIRYFYGMSLYVAGEAEAKLHHTAKVQEFWGSGVDILRDVQHSTYLSDDQRLLATHAITVMAATLKALNP